MSNKIYQNVSNIKFNYAFSKLLIYILISLIIILHTFFIKLFSQNTTIIVNNQWIQNNLSDGALFFDQYNTLYRFDTDFTAQGSAIFVINDNITIDLNGHTIQFGGNNRNGTVGIYPIEGRSATGVGSDDINYSRTAGNHEADNCTIMNGRIIWIGTTGQYATCIGGHYTGSNLTIKNMYLQTGGKDGMCIFCFWGNFTAHDNYLVNTSRTTNDRHAAPANIKSSSTVIAFDNIIVGGNCGLSVGGNSNIHNNLIRNSGFATNGYSVHIYGVNNCIIYDNIMLPSNGRGILFDDIASYNDAYNNIICVHEEPNSEFGSDLNAPNIRIRYHADKNRFHNNICLGIAGIDIGNDTLCATSGVYLSNYEGVRNFIYNNEFRTFLLSPVTDLKYANGITFEGHGTFNSFARDSIYNNIFRSNNYLIRAGGWDGSSYMGTIINNSFYWDYGDSAYNWFNEQLNQFNIDLTGNDYATDAVFDSIINVARTQIFNYLSGVSNNQNRHTFYTGYYIYDGFVTLIDNMLGTDVHMEPSDVYVYTPSGTVQLDIGHSLWIIAQDTLGNIIRNKEIIITDNSGRLFTANIDNYGLARLELIDYALRKEPNTSTVNKIIRNSHVANILELGSVNIPINIFNNINNPYILIFPCKVQSTNPPSKPRGVLVNP